MTFKVGEFAAVNHTLEEYGFIEGMPVYIAGQGFLPIDKSDGYDFRQIFVIVKTKDGHVDIEGGGFTADPKNLIELTEHVKNALKEAYKADFEEAQLGVNNAENSHEMSD